MDQLLLKHRAINSEIDQLPYKGFPVVKQFSGERYIYISYKGCGKDENKRLGPFNDSLFDSLTENYRRYLALSKKKRIIETKLSSLGVHLGKLSAKVMWNIGFVISNIKNLIYDQAVLEGIPISFSQTEQIINNEPISNILPSDVLKVLNLKRAWEFIIRKDVIIYPSDLEILKTINRIVEEGFIPTNGNVRSTLPVRITGTSYIPPMPSEEGIKEKIRSILNSKETIESKAVDLCLAVMKGQYFQGGNKRTAVIFANHFLVSKGRGILVVPYEKVPDFRKVLVNYYEDENDRTAKDFLLNECIIPMQEKKKDESKDLEM